MIYSGFNQAQNKKKSITEACQIVSRATYQRKDHETKTREKLGEKNWVNISYNSCT